MKFRKPLVSVEWEDAHGVALGDYTTDEEIDSFHKPATYLAVGFLVKDDTIGISLASEQSESGYRGMTFIPAGMVRSLTTIGKTRHAKPRVPRSTGQDGPHARPQE